MWSSVICDCVTDGPVDFSSGAGSPSIPSPGVTMPPGGLFGQSQPPATHHLKGQEEPSEDITSMNQKMYEGIDCSDLVEQLKDTDTLHEQADIIHYLYTTKYTLLHRLASLQYTAINHCLIAVLCTMHINDVLKKNLSV